MVKFQDFKVSWRRRTRWRLAAANWRARSKTGCCFGFPGNSPFRWWTGSISLSKNRPPLPDALIRPHQTAGVGRLPPAVGLQRAVRWRKTRIHAAGKHIRDHSESSRKRHRAKPAGQSAASGRDHARGVGGALKRIVDSGQASFHFSRPGRPATRRVQGFAAGRARSRRKRQFDRHCS